MQSVQRHKAKAAIGEPLRYLLEHMRDGCCYPWPYSIRGGYPSVTDDDGSPRRGHVLVCEITNGPPPEEGMVTRHLCGKGHFGCFNAGCLVWGWPWDNKQDSIEHGTWTHGEQHGMAKLTTDDVDRLRRLDATGRYTYKELGEMFDISRQQVSNIVNFKSRRNG